MRLRHALIYALLVSAAASAFLAIDLNYQFSSGLSGSSNGAPGALVEGWGTPVMLVLLGICIANLSAVILLSSAFRDERNFALLRAHLIPEKKKDGEQDKEKAILDGSTDDGLTKENSPAPVPDNSRGRLETKHAWGEITSWSSGYARSFCDLWNSSCHDLYGACPKNWDQFEKFLNAPEFDIDGSAVALSTDGKLLGAILALRQPHFEDDGYWWLESPAVVGSILVAPAYRGKGIGRTLLRYTEAEAIRRKRPRIFIGGLENFPHLVPGAPEQDLAAQMFILSEGYREVRRTCHMEAELEGFRVPTDLVEREKKLEEKGYTFATAKWEDRKVYEAFLEESNLDRKKRRLEKFESEWSRIYFVLNKGRIAGFLQASSKDELGHSGIRLIYFLRAFRGVGLGSVLLNKAHLLWRNIGAKKASIWTYPEAAERFYPRAGFKPVQEWVCYEKDLENNWRDPNFINRWR